MALTKLDSLLLVGTAATDPLLEVSATAADDANINTGTTVLDAGADLISQNVGGQKVALGPFMVANIATNASATAMNLAADAMAVTHVLMPYAGSVLGITAEGNANITAGTLTFFATVNAATTIFSAANSATGVKEIRSTQNKDVDVFSAGDSIGAKYKSTTTLAPTTLDWAVYVWVEV